MDDALEALGHRDDPQAKVPTSAILTLAILASLELGGKHAKALARALELHLFRHVPSPLAPWENQGTPTPDTPLPRPPFLVKPLRAREPAGSQGSRTQWPYWEHLKEKTPRIFGHPWRCYRVATQDKG